MKEDLQEIFKNVNEWLKFAEAKNFGLLTLNAAIVFGLTQLKLDKGEAAYNAAYYIFTPFAVFSFFSCLISLFPIVSKIEKGEYAKSWINWFCNILGKEKSFENIHFYGYLKGINFNEFENKYKNKTVNYNFFNGFEKDLVMQILYNSRITWLKYQLFKIGAFFFFSGLVLAIISLPIFNL